jgi:multidrug efflux pump subunit AcrA (membrane-fusion protein)/YHS domain-containing protein
MRRTVVAASLVALIAVSFGAGHWYSQRGPAAGSAERGRKILYYVDPMHPAYKSDKPGIAPDCGMELVPVYDDGSGSAAQTAGSRPGTVRIGGEAQQRIGVRVARVEKVSATTRLRALGRVVPDDTRTYRVIASSDGWVLAISTAAVGSIVKKDQQLASFYGPEFPAAQNTFLATLSPNDPRMPRDISSPWGRDVRGAIDRYRQALRNLGMSELQLAELSRTRTPFDEVYLLAPADGVVLARNIAPGQRIEKGAELYRISDLRQVWVLVDVFEDWAVHLRPGTPLTAALPTQRHTVQAKVSDALPQFDPTTRTLKVRLDADNPGLVLRPDMFVDVDLPVKRAPGIVVPVDAVVDAGARQVVYVEKEEGVFEPRRVETGWRHGDQVEILTGLQPGERIVVSGTFLVDSESRMKAAAAGIYGETSPDPVCKVEVDQSRARAAGRTVTHQGQIFYFDSYECKAQFERDPGKYQRAAGRGQGAAGQSGGQRAADSGQRAASTGQSAEASRPDPHAAHAPAVPAAR